LDEVDQENEDTKVIAINVGESEETVRKFVEEGGYELTVVLDPDALLSIKYLVGAVPTTYYIDAQGINLGAYPGMLPKDRAVMFLEAIRSQQ